MVFLGVNASVAIYCASEIVAEVTTPRLGRSAFRLDPGRTTPRPDSEVTAPGLLVDRAQWISVDYAIRKLVGLTANTGQETDKRIS